MKRSNIIISSVVLLLIAWFLVSGWLQANAYNCIHSQRSCNYVEIIGNERTKSLNTFRNLKIDFEKQTTYPKINIYYSIVQDISFSKNMDKLYTYKISGDTLCLSINYLRWRSSDYVNIGVTVLNSVKITSPLDDKWSTTYNDNDHNISISGFKANVLAIIFNSKYELKLGDNKLKRLELRGNYYEEGKINITNYPDYDSLDINMDGNNGTLVMSKTEINDNKNQWISIKVPQTFNIEAEAGSRIWKDVTIKKSHHEIPEL